MKIFVEEIPKRCHDCPFHGMTFEPDINLKLFSDATFKLRPCAGCKLLNREISSDLEFSGRHYACPLKQF